MGLLELCKPVPQASPEATVLEAVHTMTELRVGAIAVTVAGKITGVFTERDLMRRVVAQGRDASAIKLRDVMTGPVQYVSDDTSVAKAAALMREHHIRHLAVVDKDGNFEGMVALRYLLYALLDELEDKVGDLYGYLMVDGPGGD
jgi:CBS domain-containing protein